jgi:hypothetical protein
MDIVVWLRSLGLAKYEAAFRENEIDETVLPSLTEEHLKQLGVTALGHRVKLLDAIAALHNDASGKAPSGDLKTTPGARSPSPEDRAERRQVTVMFSDLVGSTALSGIRCERVLKKFQRSTRPHCRQKCPPTGEILRLAVCLVWPRCARTPRISD